MSAAMTFHTRLRQIRQDKGLTQEALATSVGVTRQTIIAIEKEKFVPSAKFALQLAAALKARFDDLFWLDKTGKA